MSKKAGKVAIVYSENEDNSTESKHLAYYLCGLLSSSGFASIVMIPFNAQGPTADLTHRRITYIPPGLKKPIEVPGSDVSYAPWNGITECHLVVVTVNFTDSVPCGKMLAEILQNYKNIPIFSLQRGAKQGALLADEFGSNGIVVVEGAVGFAVVLDPKYSAFVSTVPYPALAFERLSKEQVKVADLPLRLLETMKIEVYFRKNLMQFNFGVMLYENIYALNILTKGSIQDTINNRSWRLIIALMIRENLQAVQMASKGTWTPQLLLVSTLLTPKLMEMILIMPNFIFIILFYMFGVVPNHNLISPGQHDLMESRKCMTKLYLQELVDLGKRYRSASPLSELVLETILSIENSVQAAAAVNYFNTNWIGRVEREVPSLYPNHDSIGELSFWVIRSIGVISVIVMLGFLFYHD